MSDPQVGDIVRYEQVPNCAEPKDGIGVISAVAYKGSFHGWAWVRFPLEGVYCLPQESLTVLGHVDD